MQTKTKNIIIASSLIGAIAIIAGAIIIRQRRKTASDKSKLGSVDSLSTDKPVGKLIEWPLKYGSGYLSDSERSSVKTVQQYLNKKIIENNVYALPLLTVDGHFGSATESTLYKIAGVKQVSYTLFNQMEGDIKAPIAAFINNLFSVNPEAL